MTKKPLNTLETMPSEKDRSNKESISGEAEFQVTRNHAGLEKSDYQFESTELFERLGISVYIL